METILLKNIPINVDNSLNIYIFFYLVFAGAALIVFEDRSSRLFLGNG